MMSSITTAGKGVKRSNCERKYVIISLLVGKEQIEEAKKLLEMKIEI